jgi:drug/metabolite transporter (DMT)-like permease
MIYVLLSVCCSVIVSVLLKLAKRYSIDILQAIAWNYSIAMILTWLFYKPHLHVDNLQSAPVFLYIALAVLLPALFVIIGLSVKATGIVRTDVAQRLSLFIPLIASYLIFNETFTILKLVGLGIGIIAIACSIPWQKQDINGRKAGNSWMYLIIVFLGMGVIDVLFKQVALFKGAPYTTSLFIIYGLSFLVSQVVLLIMVSSKKIKFTIRHIFFGWVLGIANFGNILFYLKAHQALASNPSTVFSAMNIGVITVGAIIGLVVFKERLSNLNKAGILLAIIAIVVIAYAQTH